MSKLLIVICLLVVSISIGFGQPPLTMPINKITTTFFCDSTVVTTKHVHTVLPNLNNGLTYYQILNDETSSGILYCNIGDDSTVSSTTIKLYPLEGTPVIRLPAGTILTTWAPSGTCKRRIVGW